MLKPPACNGLDVCVSVIFSLQGMFAASNPDTLLTELLQVARIEESQERHDTCLEKDGSKLLNTRLQQYFEASSHSSNSKKITAAQPLKRQG